MKANRLSLLAIVTVIFVSVAILLARQDAPQSSQDKKLLFPDMSDKINNLGEINLQSKGQSLSLIKQGEQWQVQEAHHYPASFDKIKQTAVAVTDLRILAEKTNNPTLYKKLGVEDPLGEEASSLLLRFKDGEKNQLLSIIIGNSRQNKIPGGKPTRYVRLPESEQALLVEGELNVSLDANDWFVRDLLHINADRIRSIHIQHSDHSEIKIHRDNKEGEFGLEHLPAGRAVDRAAIKRVPALLENIYIDNVKADNAPLPAATSVLTTVKTFDGLVAKVNSAEIEGKNYITLSFSYDEPASEEKNIQHTEASGETVETASGGSDLKLEVEKLNKLVSAWRYEIPNYKFELFRKQTEDLLEKIATEDSDSTQ